MIAETTIPTTITPDAAERIAELGIQADVERMLEHTRQTVKGLRKLEVVLDPPYDTGNEPYLTIHAIREGPLRYEFDSTQNQWNKWVTSVFSPDVHRHIALMIFEESEHAG